MVSTGEIGAQIVEICATLNKMSQQQRNEFDAGKKDYLSGTEDQILWKNREAYVMFASALLTGMSGIGGAVLPDTNDIITQQVFTLTYKMAKETCKTIGVATDSFGRAGSAFTQDPATRAMTQVTLANQVTMPKTTEDKRSIAQFNQQILDQLRNFIANEGRAYGV